MSLRGTLAAYLVWIGIKEHEGVVFVALGAMALTA
jgi:hypothetical protein